MTNPTTRRLAAALRTYAARLAAGDLGGATAAACRADDHAAALAHSRAELPEGVDEALDLLLGDALTDDHDLARKLAVATADLLVA